MEEIISNQKLEGIYSRTATKWFILLKISKSLSFLKRDKDFDWTIPSLLSWLEEFHPLPQNIIRTPRHRFDRQEEKPIDSVLFLPRRVSFPLFEITSNPEEIPLTHIRFDLIGRIHDTNPRLLSLNIKDILESLSKVDTEIDAKLLKEICGKITQITPFSFTGEIILFNYVSYLEDLNTEKWNQEWEDWIVAVDQAIDRGEISIAPKSIDDALVAPTLVPLINQAITAYHVAQWLSGTL